MFIRNKKTVHVEMSARHAHLTKAHFEKLFGKGAVFSVLRALSQPGEFASSLTLDVVGKHGELKSVRILGPLRPYSQVEVSYTDARALGVVPPIRESGMHDGTPGATLVGPAGSVTIKKGVVVANRHIHCSTAQAKSLRLRLGQFVKIKIAGARAAVLDRVMIKVNDNYDWHCHLDTDEGNAVGITKENDLAEVII